MNELSDLKLMLAECNNITEILSKRIAVASIITEAFVRKGLPYPILVGGSAVEIYTAGNYATSDIDFINDLSGREYEVVEELGFVRLGKNLYHKDTDSLTEFPTGPLSGDKSRIVSYLCEETTFNVYIIGLEDLILDRLESHFSTNDSRSKEWAQRLLLASYDMVDFSYLQGEAYRRGIGEPTIEFQKKVKWMRKDFEKILENENDNNPGVHLKFI